MKIQRIEHDTPAVVVLGAGATRGASFVEDLSGVLPPLDADFFTQAQRLSSKKPAKLWKDLIENTVGVFGNEFDLTMEGYLTQLEQLSNVSEDYRTRGRPSQNKFALMRLQFLQVLAAVLDEAVGRTPKCKFHKMVVDALSPADTIISFNYDWLIDHTLKTYGDGKWNPRRGYGLRARARGTSGQGARYWASRGPSGKPSFPRRTITLLKLHGSVTWFPVVSIKRYPRLSLRTRWWHQQGDLQFEVAPPEWNKPIRSGVYKPIWTMARQAIRKSKTLVFIGYSLPDTDLPAHALFMVDGDAPALELLVIVNPDRFARRRIRRVLRRRIDNRTRVLSFDTFCEFAKFVS